MIVMLQRPLEDTRTSERPCVYEAEREVDGRRYSARSRLRSANALARVLLAAGVLDQAVEVRQAGIKGCITYRSLHEMGLSAFQETVRVPLRRVRWNPPDFIVNFLIGDAQNRDDPQRAVAGQPEPVLGRL